MRLLVKKLCVPAAMIGLLGASGCIDGVGHSGRMEHDSQVVKLGAAKAVSVELKMGSGELKIRGGSANLVDGQFGYHVSSGKPSVDYHESGDHGSLTIEEPGGKHNNTFGNNDQNWDLTLNNTVPMDLDVEMGAGEGNLTLGTLSLRNLQFNVGAGNATIDLTGNWKKDLTADINGGVGHATIRLPRDTGVYATVSGGIGSVSAPGFQKDGDAYVNDAYRKSPVTLRVTVQGGVGDIRLELASGRPVV
jgi:N-terminal domain of toast_rack, DUF2154